jgi:hypothetical protein
VTVVQEEPQLGDIAGLELALLTGDVKDWVRKAFDLFERRKARPLNEMSLSRLGGCSRDVAFRVSGTTPTDPGLDGDKRQASLGTWLHSGLLPSMRASRRGVRTEVPVTLSAAGLTLPGHADLWWRRNAGEGDVVLDVKSVKEWGLGQVRTKGPKDAHWDQADGYCLALRQTKQADVRWSGVVYVDRATGDYEPFIRPFGPAEAARVMERMAVVAKWRQDPMAAPRDEDGPGLSWLCDHCPFLRACWGPLAKPGDWSVVGVDPEQHDQITAALEEYDTARSAAAAADDRMKAARARLDRARSGQYGEIHLSWRGGSNGGQINKPAAWDALIDAGVDLYELAQEQGLSLPRRAPGRKTIHVVRKAGE